MKSFLYSPQIMKIHARTARPPAVAMLAPIELKHRKISAKKSGKILLPKFIQTMKIRRKKLEKKS